MHVLSTREEGAKMSRKECFVCGGKAKKVKGSEMLDCAFGCGMGDPLYQCTQCGAEWFSAPATKKRTAA